MIVMIIQVLLLFVSLLYNIQANKVEVRIPQAECINKILESEISYYFAQQSEAIDTCYWNLTVKESQRADINGNAAYECTLSRDISYMPNPGIAYLDYGMDIIIIEDKMVEELFAKVPDKNRTFVFEVNKVPFFCAVPYIKIIFSKDYVISISSDYDPHHHRISSNRVSMQ